MSESASPHRWGEEHEIDLGAVGEARQAPDPVPSPPRRFLRIPNVALAYAAIAIALAAAAITVVKWSPLHAPLAESTVKSFLEAVHEGDVDGALAHTDQKDAEGEFLVPEALDPHWEIAEVAQVDYDETGDGRAEAQVYTEIEAEDGSRIGHRYRVEIVRGDARIIGAMVETDGWGALEYLDLNGVRLDIDLDLGLARILLLPGYYEFYPDLPSTMDLEGGNGMLVLGNRYLSLGTGVADEWLPSPWLLVNQEGEDAVNAALREHYDACAADPSGESCPFAFPGDPDRELAMAPGETWVVVAYPEVQAEQLWYEHEIGFELRSALPGEARAQVIITEDGETRAALVSCPIWVDGLYAKLDPDGGASIDTGNGEDEEGCRSVIEVDQ